jgi:hypothetical protein
MLFEVRQVLGDFPYYDLLRSWDSVVDITTGYGLVDQEVGVRVLLGSRISTSPPIQWVPVGSFPGAKRPGREAEHSPPTSAEVKKMWIYTSIQPHVFMA